MARAISPAKFSLLAPGATSADQAADGPADRTRFYKTLTGTNEGTETRLQFSPQSAYDNLAKYGVDGHHGRGVR